MGLDTGRATVVVLDTNIIVSALVYGDLPGEVLAEHYVFFGKSFIFLLRD